MTNHVTREERIERQEQDTGDPDSRVLISRKRSYTYHDRETCVNAPEEGKLIPRREAKARWLAPCTRCVIDP